MAHISSRLSYANIMATFAVFVALGGSSYAAISLSKNSVTSRAIKNGQVKNADIAKNAVTSAKVKNGSLLSSDFKPGQLVAGAPGPAGPQGPKGDTGTVDTSNFYDKATSDSRFLAAGGKATDADKLDGNDSTAFVAANQAPAVASATNTTNATLSTTTANIIHVALNAPSTGSAIVTASGTFDQAAHASGTGDFLRAFLGTTSGGTDFNTLEFMSVTSAATSGEYSAPFSITRVFPVTAGSNDFYLTANVFSGAGSINRSNLTAVFIKNSG